MSGRRGAIAAWLAALAVCFAVIWQSRFTADMSAFLPKAPTAQQQLLVEQIKDGSLSRLLLIGIEGADAQGRARLSRDLAARLRVSAGFTSVQNGDAEALARDRALLFKYRYLLSPAVNAGRFSVDGLRQAVGDSIDLLASPAGLMVKTLIPRDPTGEMMALLDAFGTGEAPATAFGVWASRDGRRALLMAQTAAAGADTDGQERALAALRADFAAAATAAGIADAHLVYSGTPAFSVATRAGIRAEVERLAVVSAVGIVGLLLLVYRSLLTLALGLLPVLTGALAGVAAVGLGFDSVHGITIGFGITLIGEAVDYSIYYFIQARAASPGSTNDDSAWRAAFWPTIRLGLLTSIAGFASLLFSGFPGLAQLGLFSITGLLAAAAVTRFVLPALCPADLRVRDTETLGRRLAPAVAFLARGRWLVAALAVAAASVVFSQRDRLWNDRLADLSPLPADAVALDRSLRADLGAPDQRYLVVIAGATREAALSAAESASGRLRDLTAAGVIGGFETPTRFLPSTATQRARQAALPGRTELASRLDSALQDLPLRPDKLAPFLDDVEAARNLPPMTPQTLAGSRLGLAVDAMLQARRSDGGETWLAMLPLRAPASGEIDVGNLRTALGDAPGMLFLDLAGESNQLYAGYLREAILLSLAGLAVIVVLLGLHVRAPARLARLLAPLAAAVLVVMAVLALAGERLTLLHLVGLLLAFAVGSNYALFFDGARLRGIAPRTLASLAVANATTVIAFGVLASSRLPILHAIGITVGPGAVLALLFAAMLAGRGSEAR